MPLTNDDVLELARLIGHARALYDGLAALPTDDIEHRTAVWTEIIDVQSRITALLPPVRSTDNST